MEAETAIRTKLCNSNVQLDNISSCSDVVLIISKSELFNSSLIANSPSPGEFNSQYMGFGVGLVIGFYLLGFGLGQVIKMVNLR